VCMQACEGVCARCRKTRKTDQEIRKEGAMCTHTQMHTHAHAHAHAYAHAHTHTHAHARAHAYAYAHARAHAYAYAHAHAHAHAHKDVYGTAQENRYLAAILAVSVSLSLSLSLSLSPRSSARRVTRSLFEVHAKTETATIAAKCLSLRAPQTESESLALHYFEVTKRERERET